MWLYNLRKEILIYVHYKWNYITNLLKKSHSIKMKQKSCATAKTPGTKRFQMIVRNTGKAWTNEKWLYADLRKYEQ